MITPVAPYGNQSYPFQFGFHKEPWQPPYNDPYGNWPVAMGGKHQLPNALNPLIPPRWTTDQDWTNFYLNYTV